MSNLFSAFRNFGIGYLYRKIYMKYACIDVKRVIITTETQKDWLLHNQALKVIDNVRSTCPYGRRNTEK